VVVPVEDLSQEELRKLLKATEEKIAEVQERVETLYRDEKSKIPQPIDLSPEQVDGLMKNWRILANQRKKILSLLEKHTHA
jgi:predicted nuclease with TOPRIM domain